MPRNIDLLFLDEPNPDEEEVAQDSARDSSDAPKHRRVRKKSGILNGIEDENIIHIPDDDNGDAAGDASKPPSSTQHDHTTRASIHGRADALYDARYHPMDDVTRPKRAARVRGVSDVYNFEGESEVRFLSGSENDDTGPPPKKRRYATPTRRSSRPAAQKSMNYKATVHPQDASLRELGVIGNRRCDPTKSGEKHSDKRPNSRDVTAGTSNDIDQPALPLTDALSQASTSDSDEVLRYAEGWGVFGLKTGERYFRHEGVSRVHFPAGKVSDKDEEAEGDEGDASDNTDMAGLAAEIAGMTEDDSDEQTNEPGPNQQQGAVVILSDSVQTSDSSTAVHSDENMAVVSHKAGDTVGKEPFVAAAEYSLQRHDVTLSHFRRAGEEHTRTLQAGTTSRSVYMTSEPLQEPQQAQELETVDIDSQQQGEKISYGSDFHVVPSSSLLPTQQPKPVDLALTQNKHKGLSESGLHQHISDFQIHDDTCGIREISPTDAMVDESIRSVLQVDDFPKENTSHSEQGQGYSETETTRARTARQFAPINQRQAGRLLSQIEDESEHGVGGDSTSVGEEVATDLEVERTNKAKNLSPSAAEPNFHGIPQDTRKRHGPNHHDKQQVLAAAIVSKTRPSGASPLAEADLDEAAESGLVDGVISLDESSEMTSEDDGSRVNPKSLFGPYRDSPARNLLEDDHRHVKDAGFVNSQE